MNFNVYLVLVSRFPKKSCLNKIRILMKNLDTPLKCLFSAEGIMFNLNFKPLYVVVRFMYTIQHLHKNNYIFDFYFLAFAKGKNITLN